MDGCYQVVACLLGAFALTIESAGAVSLYAAPGGADTDIGDSQHPLASLQGARDRVRQMRAQGNLKEPVTVAFADGEYKLTEPVVFGPEDSGSSDAPVKYVAAKGARPVFSGGKRLPKFEVGADGVWHARVDPSLRFEQLYINGRRATRARSPNRFYYYMRAPSPYGVDPLTGQVADLSRRAFVADKNDIAPLAGKSREALSNVVVRVFHSWEVS